MLLERNDFDLSMIAYLIVPFCITLGNCFLIGIRVSKCQRLLCAVLLLSVDSCNSVASISELLWSAFP